MNIKHFFNSFNKDLYSRTQMSEAKKKKDKILKAKEETITSENSLKRVLRAID